MRVGVPKETAVGERRVALVPETVGRLGEGVEVVVEHDAGVEAGFTDGAYTEAGATIGDPWGCEVIVKVAAPSTAVIGVRSSCETVAMKSLFASSSRRSTVR